MCERDTVVLELVNEFEESIVCLLEEGYDDEKVFDEISSFRSAVGDSKEV